MTTSTDDPLVTRTKARALLGGVARSTICRWEAEGKLPPAIRITVKVQGWRRSTLEQFIESRKGGGA